MRYALAFPAEVQLRTTEMISVGRQAEDAGLDGVWVAEGRGGEAFSTLAALLMSTSRISVGAGVLPVFNRSPWLVAMGAGVLEELGGQRFLLGLGPGHPAVVQDRHGLVYERPLDRIRETVDIVRAALTGDVVDYRGSVFTLRGAQLSHPAAPVPIHLAATGPRALRLAGEVADGVILILTSKVTAHTALTQVQAAAVEAGRDPSSIASSTYVFTCVHDDRDRARDASRGTLAYYGRLRTYRKIFHAAGFEREAAGLERAWESGSAESAAAAISDAMIDAFTASGNADDVANALLRMEETGLTELTAYPYPAAGQSAIEAFESTVDAVARVRSVNSVKGESAHAGHAPHL
ncbi:LLM class flavin-dependent oxidoreductase [Amycolatopsis jejuensis]|uniref:LLM class flavin-dependent oxidoreductase n=1 Tax=Amycolatopsis jejuensis TaxID=330084 RepID=UPI0005255884|nr:LLM class flavin-dependent oxidoreductase [Amycolatopsis jejuensis]